MQLPVFSGFQLSSLAYLCAMINKVSSVMRNEKLGLPGDKILVGISGGADSVALTHLLHRAGFEVVAAHCNFGLRGAEADGDEAFVREMLAGIGIPLFVKRFETASYARLHKISIQMAARELRYDWFETIRLEQDCKAIAIAHHADDQLETSILHLIRGSGLQGIKGMKYRNGNIIRPLLGFRRSEIEAFLAQKHIAFVEDASNSETKYLRNKIRHELVPVLKQLQPEAVDGVLKSLQLLQQDALLQTALLEKERAKLLIAHENGFRIGFSTWMNEAYAAALLHGLIGEFGFKGETINNILASCSSGIGAVFLTEKWRLTVAHASLIIEPADEATPPITYVLENEVQADLLPFEMEISILQNSDMLCLKQPGNTAMLDLALLNFPLTIRQAQKGDRFVPFGMNGSRLVSDFLTDLHLSRAERKKTWVLTDMDGNILWLIGYRISGLYAVRKETVKIWKAVKRG